MCYFLFIFPTSVERFWHSFFISSQSGDASACPKVSQFVVEDSSRCGIDSSEGILFVQSDISIVVRLFNFSSQQYLGILLNLIFGNIVLMSTHNVLDFQCLNYVIYLLFWLLLLKEIYEWDFDIFSYIFLYFKYLLIYLFNLATKAAQFKFFFLQKLNICDCCEGSQALLN